MAAKRQLTSQIAQGTTKNRNTATNKVSKANKTKDPKYEGHGKASSIEKVESDGSGSVEGLPANTQNLVGFGDWNLFDPDNFLDEDDATDISSVKARNGSAYRGTTNLQAQQAIVHDLQQHASRSGNIYDAVHEAAQEAMDAMDLVDIYEAEEGEAGQQQSGYLDLNFVNGVTGFSPLQSWTMTPHRHESMAYRLEQPHNPVTPQSPRVYFDDDVELDDSQLFVF